MKTNFISASPGPEGQYPENLYYVPETKEGRPALVGTPGLIEVCDTGVSSEVRAVMTDGNKLYAVVGGTFFEIDSGYTATNKGAVSSSGKAWIVKGFNQIMILAGNAGYIYDSGTLTQITDTDFPLSSSLTFQDGYFIVTQEDSDYVFLSDLNDGTSWNALQYAAAEGNPGNLLAVISDHLEVWCFGKDYCEIWFNSGNTFTFDRRGLIEVGLGAVKSLAKIDNTIYWIDNEGRIRKAEGYTPVVISTREIEKTISEYPGFMNAVGYAMVFEGNPFYVLSFPGQTTWMYNVSTGLWNQWKSGTGRHRGNCYAYFQGEHIVGDYENGKLYRLDKDTYTDNGSTITRKRVGQTIFDEKSRYQFRINKFEIEFKEGVGLSGGVQGEDPQAMLRASKDRGKTWGNEQWRDIGKIGEYKNRAIWRNQGIARNWTPELIITDPVETVIYGATIEAKMANR